MKKTHPLVQAASAYTGYTARDVNNTFAISTGYTGGFQWDGSFIDRVLKDAEAASELPSHVNTATALAFYIKNGFVHSKPLPGDIVFYSFPTDSGTVSFDPPHVGVVTDVSTWKTASAFRAIEAQINSGLPKAASDTNGVYERTRYATDVLAFVRIPKRYLQETVVADTSTDAHVVRPSHIDRCNGAKQAATAKPEFRTSTELVQVALANHPAVRLQNANRGVFDAHMRSAIAAFQRAQGYRSEECNGIPNMRTLTDLSRYGRFTVQE